MQNWESSNSLPFVPPLVLAILWYQSLALVLFGMSQLDLLTTPCKAGAVRELGGIKKSSKLEPHLGALQRY
jgi:hypothetical protein